MNNKDWKKITFDLSTDLLGGEANWGFTTWMGDMMKLGRSNLGRTIYFKY